MVRGVGVEKKKARKASAVTQLFSVTSNDETKRVSGFAADI